MLDTETERLDAQRKRVTGGILRISSMKLPDIFSNSGRFRRCTVRRGVLIQVPRKAEKDKRIDEAGIPIVVGLKNCHSGQWAVR